MNDTNEKEWHSLVLPRFSSFFLPSSLTRSSPLSHLQMPHKPSTVKTFARDYFPALQKLLDGHSSLESACELVGARAVAIRNIDEAKAGTFAKTLRRTYHRSKQPLPEKRDLRRSPPPPPPLPTPTSTSTSTSPDTYLYLDLYLSLPLLLPLPRPLPLPAPTSTSTSTSAFTTPCHSLPLPPPLSPSHLLSPVGYPGSTRCWDGSRTCESGYMVFTLIPLPFPSPPSLPPSPCLPLHTPS